MWVEKLTRGILELDTLIGSRYVQPKFWQRAYLMWTFRNFCSLPEEVLRRWELRLIEGLRSENRFISPSVAGAPDRPIIGRVERRARVRAEVVPIRQPVASREPAVADHGEEAASA